MHLIPLFWFCSAYLIPVSHGGKGKGSLKLEGGPEFLTCDLSGAKMDVSAQNPYFCHLRTLWCLRSMRYWIGMLEEQHVSRPVCPPMYWIFTLCRALYWSLWVYTVYFWITYLHPPTYFLSCHMMPAGESISYGSPCRLSSFPCSVHLSPGLSSCAQWLRDFSSKPEAIRFTWSTDVKLQRMARVTGCKVPAERVLKSRGRRRSRHVLGPVMKTT